MKPNHTNIIADREKTKRVILSIWKVLVLNDPPTWTEEIKPDWMRMRVKCHSNYDSEYRRGVKASCKPL